MIEYKTPKQKAAFYRSTDWVELRQLALERDNYECQECKRQGLVHADSIREDGKPKTVELNVHHKQPIEEYPKSALLLDNLETLCIFHHNLEHGRVGAFKREPSKWDGDEKW